MTATAHAHPAAAAAVPPGAGPALTSTDPTTGAVVHTGPTASPADVAAAVGRAHAAFGPWSRTPLADRADLLRRFGALVERDATALTELIVAETGKVRAEAQGEVEWTVRTAHWYADHPPAVDQVASATVRRVPLGVVAAVTPWNVPLHTPAWKWLPALLAGDTVVWKPSELTPGVAVAATGLLAEAGLPAGVLELVLGGPDAGRALVGDDRVAGVHFTGSTRTGRAIAAAVAERLVPCALELGGLNPVVVLADADVQNAADCVVAAAISINGQKCTATRRVVVHERVADDLVTALRARFAAVVAGDPRDPATTLGPLVTRDAVARAHRAVDGAVGRGARELARSPDPTGHLPPEAFFPAVLLTDVHPDDPLRSEELFAPVVSLDRVADDETAWAAADAGGYGLSAAVHTRDPERAAQAPSRLRAGIVALNRRGDAVDLEAPFGGMGASGNGHPEGGEYVYSSLTRLQAGYGSVDDGA